MTILENISFKLTDSTRVVINEVLSFTDTATCTDFITTTYSFITADVWHPLALGTINHVNYIFISGDTELQLSFDNGTNSITVNKFAVINTSGASAVYLKNVSGSTSSVKVSLVGIQ